MSAPMPDVQAFHAHLNECAQCRNHPMALCSRGAVLLHGAARVLELKAAAPSREDREQATCSTCQHFDGYRCLRDVCDPDGGLQAFRDGDGQEYAVWLNRPEFGCTAHALKLEPENK